MFYFTLPLGPRSSVKLTEGLDGRQKKASNGILISSDHLERYPDPALARSSVLEGYFIDERMRACKNGAVEQGCT